MSPKLPDHEKYAPLQDGELEELRKKIEGEGVGVLRSAVNANREEAFDRMLGVLERTIDERDRQTKKATDLFIENGKLREVAWDALDLLEEREWKTEGGDIQPPHNFCPECGASEPIPTVPEHKPHCKWLMVVETLRAMTGRKV